MNAILVRALKRIANSRVKFSDSDRSSCDSYYCCPFCGEEHDTNPQEIRHDIHCPKRIATSALRRVGIKMTRRPR